MGSPYTNIIRLLCAALATAITVASLNFVVDPLRLFGHSEPGRPWYSDDSRLQDAGLIRSQDFDTILMGTSLAIHFRQSDIDRQFGVHSLKLAISGSNSVEQNFVLRAALRRRPRRVIWEMDDWIFRDAPDADSDAYLPANLYRMNAKGIAGYLFSLDMARESVWIVLRGLKPLQTVAHGLAAAQYLKFHQDDVDRINTLPDQLDLAATYNAAMARASFEHYLKHPKEIGAGYDYAAMVRNFDRDALDLIAKHPDVRFDVYFPPYSILHFVAMRDASPATLQIVYDLTAYAGRRLTQLPNVRLYDFRDAQEVTHDQNNYFDVVHHSPTIDRKVLSWITEGSHAVDRNAPTASTERLRAQVAAYRVDAGGREP
ncbi:hypothetical protein [Bradyrhizobium sp.]|uniref:hypothetical protein n=1 Tax=Bradyrhizobium sp. TaxID=376 RepID=UPI003C5DA4BD